MIFLRTLGAKWNKYSKCTITENNLHPYLSHSSLFVMLSIQERGITLSMVIAAGCAEAGWCGGIGIGLVCGCVCGGFGMGLALLRNGVGLAWENGVGLAWDTGERLAWENGVRLAWDNGVGLAWANGVAWAKGVGLDVLVGAG